MALQLLPLHESIHNPLDTSSSARVPALSPSPYSPYSGFQDQVMQDGVMGNSWSGWRERDIKHPHNFTVQIRELRLSDVGDLVWSHTLGLCGASSAQPSPDCVLGALPYTALGRSGGRTRPESCFPSSGTLASHLSCKPGAKGHCSTCSKK